MLVQSPLSQSVTCTSESVDQPSEGLPTVAVTSSSDGPQQAPHGDQGDMNQAWFTTKGDNNSLQGRG